MLQLLMLLALLRCLVRRVFGARTRVSWDGGTLLSEALTHAFPEADVTTGISGTSLRIGGEVVAHVNEGNAWEVGGYWFEDRQIDDVADVPAWIRSALQPSCSFVAVPMLWPTSDVRRVTRLSDATFSTSILAPVGQTTVWEMVRVGSEWETWKIAAGEPSMTLEAFGSLAAAGGQTQAWAKDPRVPITRLVGESGEQLYVVADPVLSDDVPLVALFELSTGADEVPVRGAAWIGAVHDGSVALNPSIEREPETKLEEILGLLRDDAQGALRWQGGRLRDSGGRYWCERG